MADHAPASAVPAELLNRRAFLNRLSLILSGLIGLVLSVPILAYLLTPLIRRAPGVWLDIGSVDQFQVGETVQVAIEDPSPLPWAGQTTKTAIWLRREGLLSFVAFAVNCTHLACPVNWQAKAEIFLCPCHGGVFYADGRVAAGPPPRPLPRYDVRVRDGTVQVLTRPVPIGD
ncbi:MAG TPA: ubiquinol-cytochrome c reductase iron-sulfur subunit [Chloroflexota bacterium]|nr:ubiquinol-cytochrome c reductase iron-sulfur subunit [Chloroflexota bacterium]